MNQFASGNPQRSRPRHRAFTLVELLVVIGIIAILVAVLLPALNKARRQANTAECASNMRQIAEAVLTYVNDNKGHLIPAMMNPNPPQANPRGGTTVYAYPDGWFWAAELVHQHYISAPVLYTPVGSANPNPPRANQSSVFQCPEGLTPDQSGPTDTGGVYGYGTYPTNILNNDWTFGMDNCATAEQGKRNDGQVCYGVATWYELNCRETGFTSNYTIGGPFNPPFISFVVPSTPLPGETELTDLSSANYQRNLSMIRHSSLMVMVGEASTVNWLNQTKQPDPNNPALYHYAPRLGARHGQKNPNGTNAYANFAFFDGHVELFPTYPIDSMAPPANNPGTDGMSAMPQSSGTVFTLWEDHQ
jgi:prepilin-type N-terminal cleavage/methylation domain-containing protein/prepilin-type processing-associated H-X9-DG protein